MLFFILLLAMFQLGLAVRPFTFRHYQKDCDAKIEDLPWQITNFVTFQQQSKANHSSYLTFDFVDINDRLELNTTCARTIPANSTTGLFDDVMHECDDDDVRFSFDGTTLEVSRWYQDKCLGPYPYNSAIAYGRIDPNATRTSAVDGVYGTKSEMHVPITSLA